MSKRIGEILSDVVIGAVIGLVASLLTTIILKVLEWRREDSVRWDKDILGIATEALIASERATGRIYAWSQGEFAASHGRSRPDEVDAALDGAHYRMKSLAILFPDTEPKIIALQGILVDLANRTGQVAGVAALDPQYVAEAEVLRSRASEMGAQVLDAVQRRLRVDLDR